MQKNDLGVTASDLMDLDVAFHAFLVSTINRLKVFSIVYISDMLWFHIYTEYLITGFFSPKDLYFLTRIFTSHKRCAT